MGHDIQHPHRSQTSGVESGDEKRSSLKRGTHVSGSHCHSQTAIMFVFTGFLETYFNLPLNVSLSLQAYIR